MSTSLSPGSQKPLLIGVILIVGFCTIFFVYYKPKLSWLPCHGSSENPKIKTCTDICLGALDIANNTKPVDDTVFLVWMYPFGHKHSLTSCHSLFHIEGCHLTDDKNLYNNASGVIFHHRDINYGLQNMPKKPRPPHQRWVWMNAESPSNSGKIAALNNLFNLTANYRQDADVVVPYGKLVKATSDSDFEIPKKNKLVCWVVSNWHPNYARVKYFNELSKYIKVEAYGRHFGRYIDHNDYSSLMSSCKFYLSFENSIHKDYITEKLYNALRLGSVPVVLGPPRENYEQHIPGEAFIHVNDFPSAKELAERLQFLDKNEEQYRQYFTWHKHFDVKLSLFGLEHACRACDYVRRNQGYKVFTNLNTWYWG
ncbi:alpha-(1,3)-fucosyltransferase 9-like [Chanos chanos]|uniref:Fucosyltransferase n=1 Tax=Chanos chanos TaxID=29144 RepID=A0A6J2VAD1_CHACN|nr:alpha-(1,3)-fucosyltransferase 9-like [Chanos chanos]